MSSASWISGISQRNEYWWGKIEAVKAWSELKSISDIQIFLGFANFYRRFIQKFGKIAAPLTSMLETTSNGILPKAADNSSFLTF